VPFTATSFSTPAVHVGDWSAAVATAKRKRAVMRSIAMVVKRIRVCIHGVSVLGAFFFLQIRREEEE
jgi:hypothetical protein